MKIKSLTLRHYKQFTEEKTFWFTDTGDATGEVNDITLLVGNNGTGKSSILLAALLIIEWANSNPENIDPDFVAKLNFPGLNYQYLSSGGKGGEIEANVMFSDSELVATKAYFSEIKNRFSGTPEPSLLPYINLKLDVLYKKINCQQGLNAIMQMSGYRFANYIDKETGIAAAGARHENVGRILIYHDKRTVLNRVLLVKDTSSTPVLINELTDWDYFHRDLRDGRIQLEPGQIDRFSRLKSAYEAIFPGRTIRGTRPQRYNGDGRDFIFWDGQNEYNIDELSAGEQAIFPILMDFASRNINNSIILIDEIELHLHPPLQQALLRALPKLGKNNQFIVTTHSDYIVSQFSTEQIIRLDA